ncbi:MAG: hypothetical protein AAF581_06035 [Planctomycetota bacterium]
MVRTIWLACTAMIFVVPLAGCASHRIEGVHVRPSSQSAAVLMTRAQDVFDQHGLRSRTSEGCMRARHGDDNGTSAWVCVSEEQLTDGRRQIEFHYKVWSYRSDDGALVEQVHEGLRAIGTAD